MNFQTQQAFEEYLSDAVERSNWLSPVEADSQDELLMLLTCSYRHVDGRFVLLCRKLRDGETPEEMQRLFAGAG